MHPKISQIHYSYRFGAIVETETFKQNLKAEYTNVAERPTWMPAAGGSFEILFDLFINSPLADLIKDALLGFFINETLKPFFKALSSFNNSNNNNLELEYYSFIFEDTTVKVFGVNKNFTSIFAGIFNKIAEEYPKIQKSIDSSMIHEITIPAHANPFLLSQLELDEENDFLTHWGISYSYGCEYIIWDVKNSKPIENQL